MQVHDWVVATLVLVDLRVGVKSNNYKIALLLCFLEKVQVTNVEQIESASHIYDFIAFGGTFSVAELHDLLCCWEELT